MDKKSEDMRQRREILQKRYEDMKKRLSERRLSMGEWQPPQENNPDVAKTTNPQDDE